MCKTWTSPRLEHKQKTPTFMQNTHHHQPPTTQPHTDAGRRHVWTPRRRRTSQTIHTHSHQYTHVQTGGTDDGNLLTDTNVLSAQTQQSCSSSGVIKYYQSQMRYTRKCR